MKRRPALTNLIAAVVAFGFAFGSVGTALAADCTRPQVQNADQAMQKLDSLRRDQCLGGTACTSAICARVAEFESAWKDKKPTDATYRDTGTVFSAIRASADQLPANGMGVAQLQHMFSRWATALGGTGPITQAAVGKRETKQWEVEPPDYRIFARTPDALVVETELQKRCTSPEACTAALAQVSDVIERSLLVHRTLTVALGADDVLGPYFDNLRARWSAYNNASRAIYPWELALNGYLLDVPKEGFVEPPSSQVLLLHPGAGMMYQKENSEVRGAITLDVIGFYSWQWAGPQRTEIRNESGWSIAAGWDGERAGYGLGLHFSGNRSLYILRDKDAKVMIAFSIDFGNYLLDKKSALDDIRERGQQRAR